MAKLTSKQLQLQATVNATATKEGAIATANATVTEADRGIKSMKAQIQAEDDQMCKELIQRLKSAIGMGTQAFKDDYNSASVEKNQFPESDKIWLQVGSPLQYDLINAAMTDAGITFTASERIGSRVEDIGNRPDYTFQIPVDENYEDNIAKLETVLERKAKAYESSGFIGTKDGRISIFTGDLPELCADIYSAKSQAANSAKGTELNEEEDYAEAVATVRESEAKLDAWKPKGEMSKAEKAIFDEHLKTHLGMEPAADKLLAKSGRVPRNSTDPS